MTRRGQLTLALGAAAYLAAWLFGVRALYPVATGLVLAVLAARAWVGLAGGPIVLRRRAGRGLHFEGEDVWVTLEAIPEARLPPPSLAVREQGPRLGERRTALARGRRSYRGTYVLEAVRRGRYSVEQAVAVLEDPFGLAHAEVALEPGAALVVYPRLVELGALFSETGAHAQEGRRLLLRRPSGFDLHSVREYEQGESLRKVHWPTTARRGRLMVKELEDSPRDEIAIVLDTDERGVAGNSFDEAVRAAGSILRTHVARGRRCLLVLNAVPPLTVPVVSLEGDWRAALDALAAVETGWAPALEETLARAGGPAARALELVVVTSRIAAGLSRELARRAGAGQGVSLVWVDSPSFAGRPSTTEPELLRLSTAGVAIAVVREGDDLGSILGAAPVVLRA